MSRRISLLAVPQPVHLAGLSAPRLQVGPGSSRARPRSCSFRVLECVPPGDPHRDHHLTRLLRGHPPARLQAYPSADSPSTTSARAATSRRLRFAFTVESHIGRRLLRIAQSFPLDLRTGATSRIELAVLAAAARPVHEPVEYCATASSRRAPARAPWPTPRVAVTSDAKALGDHLAVQNRGRTRRARFPTARDRSAGTQQRRHTRLGVTGRGAVRASASKRDPVEVGVPSTFSAAPLRRALPSDHLGEDLEAALRRPAPRPSVAADGAVSDDTAQ